MKITKRNGTTVEFNINKVINAIKAANDNNDSCYKMDDEAIGDIANEVDDCIYNSSKMLGVEDIQDLIEQLLVRDNYYDTAKAFIRYRYKKEVARNMGTDFIDAIEDKLIAANVQNQNANVDEHSFGGRMGEATAYMTKKYALEHCVSPMSKYNHENNMIYIHDLDNYAVGSHNCLSIPIDDLLAKGFDTRQTDIRPAGSAQTAFQLLAVVFQLQSLQQFGGVSYTHLDWSMVPYVRKSFYKHYKDGLYYVSNSRKPYEKSKETILDTRIDDRRIYPDDKAYEYAMDMTKKEIYQGSEGMYHNLSNWAA